MAKTTGNWRKFVMIIVFEKLCRVVKCVNYWNLHCFSLHFLGKLKENDTF
jgi:hypothetical protein